MIQTLNESGALERHNGGAVLDLANAGAGLAAAADASIAVAWAQKYAVVYHVVDQIVDTPLFPVGFWPMPIGVKPSEFRTPWLKHPTESPEDYGHRRRIAAAGGTTAALWGESYGWSPPQSWRLIYVANGKASLYAEGVNALLRAQGFGIERLERTEDRARLRIRRPGGPWVEYEFTMADAERAGYVPRKGPNAGNDDYGKPKKGGNEKYNTDPKTMLWARNLTVAARIEAPDVIAGMPVAELVDDEPLELARDVTVTASAQDALSHDGGTAHDGPAKLRELIAEQQKPAAPEEAPAGVPEQPAHEPWPISDQQWRKINARFVELGVTGSGRDLKRLAVISEIVGRLIERGGQLTAADADLVLDNLAGTSGGEFVDRVLNPVDPSIGDADPDTDEVADGDERGAGDQDSDPDVHVMNAEQRRRAALEGVPDPWGINS